MDRAPRIAVMLLPDAPWATLVERARRAEALGFDVAWVADHFVNPYAPEGDWFEGWTSLAGLAAATTTIRVGPLVSGPTLRSPAILARMALTVDHISGGRLELGMGAGGAPLDATMTGAPSWRPGERIERLDESLRIVTTLMESGGLADSPMYGMTETFLAPRPVQSPRPPITVSANGPRAMAVAARWADRWDTYAVAAGRDVRGRRSGPEALAMLRERNESMSELCRSIGRDPASLGRSCLTLLGYREPLPSPGAFVEIVRELRGVGFDDVTIYWPAAGAGDAAIEAIGTEALPRLRASTS